MDLVLECIELRGGHRGMPPLRRGRQRACTRGEDEGAQVQPLPAGPLPIRLMRESHCMGSVDVVG